MCKQTTTVLSAILISIAACNAAFAGEVKILAAEFQQTGDELWSLNVTLRHDDSGWEHYADNWRVVDGRGNVLGDRVLYHPHVDEQPFTRGLSNVKIPDGAAIVSIEAHDKVHGWTPERLEADLGRASGGRLTIEAKE